MTEHHISASEQTVQVGVIRRSFAPILTIDNGDEVVLETWGLWGNAVTPETTFDDVIRLKKAHVGKGPHSLTGPIAVRGARVGTALQIDILDLELGPYGFNLITPPPNSRGLLTHQFPHGEIRKPLADRKPTENGLCLGAMAWKPRKRRGAA